MLKLEVDIPREATKVDLGPVLEPILRRIVTIDKSHSGEFKEKLSLDGNLVFGKVHPRSAIPSLTESVEQWLDWVTAEQSFEDSLSKLKLSTGRRFLEDNGWEEFNSRQLGYQERDLLRSWKIEVKKYAYEFDVTHIVNLPKDNLDLHLRTYYWSLAINEIVSMYYSRDYRNGLNRYQVLEKIWSCAPPLVQLANQLGRNG